MDFNLDGLPINNPHETIQHQKETIRQLEVELKRYRGQLLDNKQFFDAVAGAVSAFETYPVPRKSRSELKTEAVACLMLSDWHIGEVVNANETSGVNEYNWEIAQQRMNKIVSDYLRWVDMHRSTYKIDECCVFTLGDMITGNLHRELLDTNEFPVPQAVVNAGNLLGGVYHDLGQQFSSLRALQVSGGNHDRLTVKPRFKQRSADSYGSLIHHIANAMVSSARNFSFEAPESFAPEFEVAGRLFHCTHGDVVQGQMGIPYYGFWRYISRVARKRMETRKSPVDTFLFGHWHQFAVLEDGLAIINRSLIGPTEYDEGAQRYASPGQVAFLVSPNHGTFNITPFSGIEK